MRHSSNKLYGVGSAILTDNSYRRGSVTDIESNSCRSRSEAGEGPLDWESDPTIFSKSGIKRAKAFLAEKDGIPKMKQLKVIKPNDQTQWVAQAGAKQFDHNVPINGQSQNRMTFCFLTLHEILTTFNSLMT